MKSLLEVSGQRQQVSAHSSAAVFAAPRRIEIEAREVPEPGAGQVRVRLEGSGVCASNLPVWQGRPWFQYPMAPGAPGHEGWGRVDAIGEDVHGIAIGDRVVTLSQSAYAEHDIADVDAVVPLPASLGDAPFPGEPLGCAMNILRRSKIQSGQTVAVVGIGFIGAAMTMLASRVGARVIAISRRPFALEVAERCGASFFIRDEGTQDVLRQAHAIVGDAGCERVIEAMGTQDALDIATGLAGVRARVVIAGYHQDGDRRIDMQSWNWRGLDIINAHEREPQMYARGVRDAINAVSAGVLDPSMLLTHQFPLAELDHAFGMMEERPAGFLKAWVRPE